MGAAYIANYLVAWKTATSWSISMVRMLIWAFVAYLCISNCVDILAEDRTLWRQIAGLEDVSNPLVVSHMRSRLGAYIASLMLSLVCIGVGFEKTKKQSGE